MDKSGAKASRTQSTLAPMSPVLCTVTCLVMREPKHTCCSRKNSDSNDNNIIGVVVAGREERKEQRKWEKVGSGDNSSRRETESAIA